MPSEMTTHPPVPTNVTWTTPPLHVRLSRVTDYICGWRGREGRAPHAFVPLKFEPGEAFQFDWSEEGLVIGGIYRHMQVSAHGFDFHGGYAGRARRVVLAAVHCPHSVQL